MELPKLELIHWIDVQNSSGWHVRAEIIKELETPTVYTCGFIEKENNENIWVIQSLADEDYTGAIVIPKALIRKRTLLTLGIEVS